MSCTREGAWHGARTACLRSFVHGQGCLTCEVCAEGGHFDVGDFVPLCGGVIQDRDCSQYQCCRGSIADDLGLVRCASACVMRKSVCTESRKTPLRAPRSLDGGWMGCMWASPPFEPCPCHLWSLEEKCDSHSYLRCSRRVGDEYRVFYGSLSWRPARSETSTVLAVIASVCGRGVWLQMEGAC